MYKWGFYILLGVNIVFLAVFFLNPKETTEEVHVGLEQETQTSSSLVPEKGNSIIRRLTAGNNASIKSEVDDIKERFFQEKRGHLKHIYSLFYKHNNFNLSDEELAGIEISLLKFPPKNTCDCRTNNNFDDFKADIIAKGFESGLVEEIVDLFLKEEFYYILTHTVLRAPLSENMLDLVNELHQLRSTYKELHSSITYKGNQAPSDDSYFLGLSYEQARLEGHLHQPDLLTELGTLLEEPDLQMEDLSEEEFSKLQQNSMHVYENTLSKDGIVLYGQLLKSFEQYIQLSNGRKIRILKYIDGEFFKGH